MSSAEYKRQAEAATSPDDCGGRENVTFEGEEHKIRGGGSNGTAVWCLMRHSYDDKVI
jgi:hypothetical protein